MIISGSYPTEVSKDAISFNEISPDKNLIFTSLFKKFTVDWIMELSSLFKFSKSQIQELQ